MNSFTLDQMIDSRIQRATKVIYGGDSIKDDRIQLAAHEMIAELQAQNYIVKDWNITRPNPMGFEHPVLHINVYYY